jgi:hypothetical protein
MIWKRALLVVMMSLSLSACMNMWGERSRYGFLAPTPTWMRGLPQGSDSFSTGFRDGCYNMLGQSGYGMMRVYDAPPEPLATYDRLYANGYMHGDRYCSTYVFKATIL